MRELPPIEPTVLDRQRSQELLMIYDDFMDLRDSCAFFCDAVTCLLEVEAALDPSTRDPIATTSNGLGMS